MRHVENEQALRARFQRIEELLGPCAMTFDQFYAQPHSIPCCHCEVLGEHTLQLFVHATDFGRVNMMSHWAFCSTECRAAWFDAGAAYDFRPITEHHGDLGVADRGFCLSLIVCDGPLTHTEPMVILHPDGDDRRLWTYFGECVMRAWLPDAASLNAWWHMPKRLTSSLHTVQWMLGREVAA